MARTMVNPLRNYEIYAPYEQIKAEHIVPAVEQAIEEAGKKLELILKQLESESLTFASTLRAFIEMDDIVEQVWTPVENLLSLMGSQDIRDAANQARPKIVEFYNNFSLDPRVYELVKKFAASSNAHNLDGEEKRHLENTLIDFKLSGAELEGADKEEFKKLNLKLSELCQKFSENATDSKFELVLTKEEELAGLPEDIITAAKAKADEYRQTLGEAKIPLGAVLFNLDYPSYLPFMKFAARSDLRKLMYFKYLTKATKDADGGLLSETKPGTERGKYDNETLIAEIFKAKLQKAKLLGFKNYAELSLQTKMAPSPKEVKEFLERLATKAKPLAEKDYQDLVEFQKQIDYKNSEEDQDTVYPWDKEYISEKLRKERFDFDTNLTKPYFELRQTVNGMFDIAKKLFSIELKPNKSIPVWHEDVEVYEIYEDGKQVGMFYMDLYPRDIKRQGAWVMPLVAACENPQDKSRILAQCTLSCNLSRPRENEPSLLTHIEVVTLFHEFGHALHHLLSKVKLEPLSGTNVEWDFVELPSQLNENFIWEREALKSFAKHYKTAESIPDDLIDKMLAARTFNEGLACIRQLEFALFDLAIYMREDAGCTKTPNEIFEEIVDQYGIFPVLQGTNFPCSFSHIFAGGYAAGYYSYKWAEVLEADAFSRFQKEGVLNPQVGQEYKQAILERGDSKEPMQLFKDFMGREPQEEALLKRMGVVNV